MKFILAEPAKFTLTERFKLAEDTLLENDSAISTNLQGLFTKIENLKAVLKADFDLTILKGTPLETDKDNLETELRNIRENIVDLLYGNKQFKNLLEPIYNNARNKSLSTNFSNTAIGQITTACKNLNKLADKIKTETSKLKNKKIAYSKDKPTEFTDWFEGFKKTLTIFEEAITKLYDTVGAKTTTPSDSTKRVNLAAAFEELLALSEKQPNAFIKKDWDYKAVTDEDTRITELTQFISKAKTFSDAVDEAEKAAKQVPTASLIWDAYFAWVWEDKITDNGIKMVLISQLGAKGFSEVTNEFIGFLRYIILKKSWKLTAGAYTAIHNLRAKNILTAKHLSVDADRKISLILCPAVLATESGNTVYRLIAQSIDLLKAINKKLTYTYVKDGKEATAAVDVNKAGQVGILSFVYTNPIDPTGNIIEQMAKEISNSSSSFLIDTNKECFLNPNCVLRPESKIAITIAEIKKALGLTSIDDEEAAVSDKTAITGKELALKLWERIIRPTALDTDKSAIANFFSHIIIKFAANESVAANCYRMINNALFDKDSSEVIKDNTVETINKLALYNSLIKNIKLTSSNLENTIKILFDPDVLPKGLT